MTEHENEILLTTGNGITLQEPGAIQPVAEPTPVSLLQQALAQGVDTDTLTKFMDLQERYEANEARKAYADAMSKCQKALPKVIAGAENTHTESSYAKLEHINAAITPVYSKNGFSISFGEDPIDGDMIRITATVLHKLGHKEKFVYDLPLDLNSMSGKANKTAIHAKGSTTTYGRRYLTMMIFNLTVGDDTDGNLPRGGSITEDEALELAAMATSGGLVHAAVLREFGVREYRDVPDKKFEKAKARIEKLIKTRRGS